MVINFNPKLCAKTCFATFLFLGSPLVADEIPMPMSEADLRTLVPFGAEASLKYAECEKKSYPTCTYIWGVPDSADALRVQMGGKPDGDRLMTIFAQAKSAQDFDRVLSTYKDAVPLEYLGVAAVWSEARDQLSLITDDYMVIHVNVEIPELEDTKAVATQVAAYLLAAR
ncbi:hypothetical protein [uncultured Sulfitobacter sp.]|jgi:hypothetical protein|uniref:hypothetical protein n=1 Tax=uncultured Sulfitobacter sp. TaxID=191468 RepID=UPI0025E2556F|nr:hypothetical protein [uncultured Sulfitobacter sp.]